MASEGLPNHAIRFEELAHRTWPCLEESRLGEWILRAANGFTRRANSALASGSPDIDLDAALDALSAWSGRHGIEPCVKITPLAPPDLDRALEARGWHIATPALVCHWSPAGRTARDPVVELVETCPTPVVEPVETCRSRQGSTGSTTDGLHITSAPSPEWLANLFCWDGTRAGAIPHHEALLARMTGATFASWTEEGRMLALAVSVRDGSAAHLYDLVVAPEARGRGIGGRFVPALLAHLERDGVGDVVLQVLESNTIARALYDKTDFVSAYRYHYRVAPLRPACQPTCGC